MSDSDAQQPVAAAPNTAQTLGSALWALAHLGERLTRLVEDNQEPIRRLLEGAAAVAAGFEGFKVWVVDDIAAEDGSELRAVLLKREMETLRTVIRHGWYPTADMSGGGVALLAQGLEDPDEERAASARQVFINKFREDADKLEQTLVEQFPRQAPIISDAFAAHRRGDFNLSVPVFFAQADGIAWDRFGKTLFSSKTIREADRLASDIREDILRELFLALMWPEWPHALPVSERPDGFAGLNRHQVMHGESCDYGTEENSLKAMALLNFCSFILLERPST